MAATKVFLQGGGEHAQVVLDCLHELGSDVAGVFDPKGTGTLMGTALLGPYDSKALAGAKAVVAIGDNRLRKEIAGQTAHAFENVIHPSSFISKFAAIGTGCMILHRVVIQAQAKIGDHVIVNTGAQVDHDCIVEDFVHLAPAAVLCGKVTVGEGSLIGAGAILIPGIRIGRWATVGAGAVVTVDVPEGATVVGNPARILKAN